MLQVQLLLLQDEIKTLFKKLKEVKVDRKCDAFVGVQARFPSVNDISSHMDPYGMKISTIHLMQN